MNHSLAEIKTFTRFAFVHAVKCFKVASIGLGSRMDLREGQVRKTTEEIVQKSLVVTVSVVNTDNVVNYGNDDNNND